MARRIGFLSVAFFAAALAGAEPSMPQLFEKAKGQFRLAAYAQALDTFSQIERLAAEPENARFRSALRPSLAFYRGACLAALDRRKEALAQFRIYLTLRDALSLDPAAYPRKVIAAMEEARRAHRDPGERSEWPLGPHRSSSISSSLFPAEPESGENWDRGPVRVLLTSEERIRYERLFDPVSRSEFVTNFWNVRDPRPETPENEFREEFEWRVAYADAHLSEDETRGSLTDRGAVFLLVGPPTYVGRKPLTTGDDSSDPAGMSMYSRNDINNALLGGGSARTNQLYDRMTSPGTKLPSHDANWIEIWHYRKDLLPAGVRYQQVDFVFITRKGYGKNVLQRDASVLNTMDALRDGARVGAR
jgi:GWxTD domain-containing protein